MTVFHAGHRRRAPPLRLADPAAGRYGRIWDLDFYVDFHPARPHEIHLPGRDPTTEIFS